MKISVTIATYNRAHLLKMCLDAISKQTLLSSNFEVIVCDSNSTDDTKLVVDEFIMKNPDVILRHLHTKNILAAKRNLGIMSARGDIVVFFDDDCVPDKDCLSEYYNLFSSNVESKNVYCGEVRFPQDWVAASNYYKFRDSRHFGSGNRLDVTTISYKTIVVMNMAFNRKSFIDNIGLVNEGFIGYGCEDQDLGWRLEESGFLLNRCSSKITHYEESGTIQGYAKKIFHTARDGAATLLVENISAFKGIKSLKLIDSDYPYDNVIQRIVYTCIRKSIFHSSIADMLSFVVTKFDKNKAFYSALAFRYILACAYISGVKCRGKAKNNLSDWYS